MHENMTRTQDYMPSSTTWIIILLLALMFETTVILLPAAKTDMSGQTGRSASVVPEYDTEEYDAFTKKFEAEHDRKYNIQDQLAAIRNGGLVLIGYFGIGFAFVVLCLTVYDNACWLQHRRVWRYRKTGLPPRNIKTQATRTGLALTGAVLLGVWYFLVPYLVTSI